ncbi:MAG TPA: prepilin-type N-terminal cleavage/methylation domain-containing protein [Phycisphaerae bacterium]
MNSAKPIQLAAAWHINGGPGLAHKDAKAQRFKANCMPFAPWRLCARFCVRRAFTLVELLVVVIVITVLLGIILPALSRMWQQRNVAATETSVRGLLATARANALHRGERGLFFFVDGNVQKAAMIAFQPLKLPVAGAPQPDDDPAGTPVQIVRDRFRVVGPIITLPRPMRVCPRNVVDDNDNNPMTEPPPASDLAMWNKDELGNDNYLVPAAMNPVQPQWHRNFFTIIFDRDGQIVPRRSVLIQDIDAAIPPATTGDGKGDRTGLKTATGVPKYWRLETIGAMAGQLIPSDFVPPPAALNDLLVDPTSKALNFVSADGLLVYDEDVYREQPTGVDKRKYLLDNGQPYFVSRFGEIVQGQRGKP